MLHPWAVFTTVREKNFVFVLPDIVALFSMKAHLILQRCMMTRYRNWQWTIRLFRTYKFWSHYANNALAYAQRLTPTPIRCVLN